MNEVTLSGRIVVAASITQRGDGGDIAHAVLAFNAKEDTVALISVNDRTHLLTRFKKNDVVVVSGKLTIHPRSRRCAVLVNESRPIRETDDQELEEWNARRRFERHAHVVGSRWAKRPNWVK
jgi:hypothetical protein